MKTTLSRKIDQLPLLRIHSLYKDQLFLLKSLPCTHFFCFYSCLALTRQNDVRIHAYLFISFVHRCIVFNALLPTLYNSLFICTGTQVFPMLDWHTPIYGSPFNLSAFYLWTFPMDSYVQIVLKYGILSCSFSDILTLVDFMQMNVHPRSF